MENVGDHSTAKLALAVFTSPGAAFEEITRRKLLGTGLVIVAIAGAVAALPPLVSALGGERIQWLQLGKTNPVAWLGLCMLYALAMQKLLKWIGAQVGYVALLTLMGWSQIALVLAQIGMCAVAYSQMDNLNDPLMLRIGLTIALLFSLWYVALMGTAVRTISGSPVARGILSYIVVHIAAAIGFSYTYINQRTSSFAHGLPGLGQAAGNVAGYDQLPWCGAAVIGLVIGVMQIGKHFEWPAQTTKLRAGIAGLIGLAVFSGYAYGMWRVDYYGRLGRAQNAYIREDYAGAAKAMTGMLPIFKDKTGPAFFLALDAADTYYLAGNAQRALTYYDRASKSVPPEGKQAVDGALAHIRDCEGAVLDSQGKYPEALAKFQQSAKLWPEFREPWVRMAVTYDRMGNYDKAIESGNHAMKKLGSEAMVGWIALAQAFANTGDAKQAKAAMIMVKSIDKKLAERIGSSLDDWKSAVSKLSRVDLKFPLEAQLAPAPTKPKADKQQAAGSSKPTEKPAKRK